MWVGMPEVFFERVQMSVSRIVRTIVVPVLCAGLLACSQTPPPHPHTPGSINDPFEAGNRQRHRVSVGLDRTIIRPLSQGYGNNVPAPVQTGVTNVVTNLRTPTDVVNNLLQGRPGRAIHNTVRFVVNSTIGLGGLIDVATGIGLEKRPTDFDETLHVWQVGEGPYLQVPLIGPSTTRHLNGRIVDVLINPLGGVSEISQSLSVGLTVANALGKRYHNTALIDGILYESADSYVQSRLAYLQNRRFKLRQNMDGASDTFDLDAELP